MCNEMHPKETDQPPRAQNKPLNPRLTLPQKARSLHPWRSSEDATQLPVAWAGVPKAFPLARSLCRQLKLATEVFVVLGMCCCRDGIEGSCPEC